jgi:glycosyltransferase involved in cell wall biosynthesis
VTRVLVDLLFWSGTRGGTETYVREVYSRLASSDLEIVGLASRELAAAVPDWFPGELVDSGISAANRAAWALGEVRAVDRAARRVDADVVHSPANLGPTRPTVPLLLTLHDLLAFRHPEWVPTRATGPLLRWMIRGAARHAARLVTSSDDAKADIVEVLDIPADRIAVVPLASSTASTTHGDEHRRDDLLFSPANRMPHKGLEILVKALALLPSPRPRLALTASRPGDPLAALAERLGIRDDVVLNGWIPREELERLYAEAALVVLPTRFEGFGLPVLEAMLHGAPVLCSDLPVLREVGADAAAYVEPGSAEALARAISELLGNSRRRAELAEAGRARAARYSWERTAASFEIELRRTADQAGRA